MKRILIVAFIAVGLLVACIIVPESERRHPWDNEVETQVPALPHIVVLGRDPFYYHNGYHYNYRNDRWYYSSSRNGPWAELPQDRYPKEIRFEGKEDKWERDDERNRGHDRE